MGQALNQRLGLNSTAYRAASWAARIQALLVFFLILAAWLLAVDGNIFAIDLSQWAKLIIGSGVTYATLTLSFGFILYLVQRFAAETKTLEYASQLKLPSLIIIGIAVLDITVIVIGTLFDFPTPSLLPSFLMALGLPLYKYVDLIERANSEGPAEWAIAAARRIAEKD